MGRADPFTSGILQGDIAIRRRMTIYTGFGDWFAYTCLALSVGFLGASAWARYLRGPRRD